MKGDGRADPRLGASPEGLRDVVVDGRRWLVVVVGTGAEPWIGVDRREEVADDTAVAFFKEVVRMTVLVATGCRSART
jgi:hypothetical protein